MTVALGPHSIQFTYSLMRQIVIEHLLRAENVLGNGASLDKVLSLRKPHNEYGGGNDGDT